MSPAAPPTPFHNPRWGFGLVAGPCSAESPQQVLAAAAALHSLGGEWLRVGLWKPRTRPGGFQGVGAQGLEWVQVAKQHYPLRAMAEVALPAHVEAALRAGVDAVWVGARTATDPFATQALADALAGTHLPVMVKNPLAPDVGLWLGALERLEAATRGPLLACHRGFAYGLPLPVRNAPEWHLVHQLRRHRPDFALVGDPSHIAGSRHWVGPIALAQRALGFSAWMVEFHPQPENARTDAEQQLGPEDLAQLLEALAAPAALAHPAPDPLAQEYAWKLSALTAASPQPLGVVR